MSGCRFISLKFLELHLLICYWYQDSPFLFVCHLLFFGPLLCLPSPTIQTIQVSDKWDGIFWLSSVSWADWTLVSNVCVWLRTTVIWSVACHLWLRTTVIFFYGLWLVTFVWLKTTVIWSVACHLCLTEDNCDMVCGLSLLSDIFNPEGRLAVSDIFPCLVSQGCHLIPLSYLHTCFSA